MLTPLAVALVVVLIADGVRRRARPSWGSVLAHVGVLIVLASAVATTFSEAAVRPLAPGEAMTVGGARVELVSWTAHPLHDTAFRVEAHLRVDGRADHAALDVYPERRASLPHVEKHSTLVRDVKVAVVRAIDEERLLIELRVVPFARGLWIGGLLVVAGGVVALVTRWRRPPVADHGTGAAQVEASTPGRVVAR
jgi:cytochrome c-type biogenesis protein CcmF